MSYLLLFFIFLYRVLPVAKSDCLLRIPETSEVDYPLLMKLDAFEATIVADYSSAITVDTPSLVHPRITSGSGASEEGIVKLKSGEKVLVFCTGDKNVLNVKGTSSGELECSDDSLKLDDTDVEWSDCSCKTRPYAELRTTNIACGAQDEGLVHVIGFELQPGEGFLPLLRVCFDHQLETTLYVQHRIQGKSLLTKASDGRRPSFKNADVFRSAINQLYQRSQQRAVLTRLGLTSSGTKFLARGHLSPDADFPNLSEQDATYFYSNVVPQWQDINNGNWKNLEDAVRALASAGKGRTLLVVTGTAMGPLSVGDKRGRLQEVFLGGDKVPVPAAMWKVVTDPKSRASAAILQINSQQPSTEIIETLSNFAESICQELPWVDWDITDAKKGYTFCWRAEDMAKFLPYAPIMTYSKLLL